MDEKNQEECLLNRTTAFCGLCNGSHPARIVREGSEVYFVVECTTEKKNRISSDAALFLRAREKSAYQQRSGPKDFNHKWGYVIDVTRECDCTCPICFNSSGPQNPARMLSVDEILALADQVTQDGRKAVVLSGGEPTLHPDLATIITRLSRRGFRVSMASNGLRLAQDPGLIEALKRAGLKMVFLQLDTLQKDIHLMMRGNVFIEEKMAAARQIVKAKVRLGIILTAVRINVPQLGEVMSFCASLGPAFSLVDIQIASPSGRFELPKQMLVDREIVIKALCETADVAGLTTEHFWPQPHFHPWRSFVHPDCSSTLLMVTEKGASRLFDEHVDLHRFYALLNGNRMRSNLLTRNLVPLYYLLKSSRPTSRLKILRHILGFALMRGTHGVFAVTINNLMQADTLDEMRLERCGTCFLTANGIAAGCLVTAPCREEDQDEHHR